MRIRSPFLNRLLIRVATWSARMLYRTCRVRDISYRESAHPYSGDRDLRYVFSIWHEDLFHAVFGGTCPHMAGLVSRHRDGGYLAFAMERVGVVPVRGSSSSGGAAAVREVLDQFTDLDVAVTPDGPRGPHRKIKAGAVYLASKLGREIVPCFGRGKRIWRIGKGWTTVAIPKPFSRVDHFYGRPVPIPAELSKAELRRFIGEVQAAMDELTDLIEGDPDHCPNWPVEDRDGNPIDGNATEPNRPLAA